MEKRNFVYKDKKNAPLNSRKLACGNLGKGYQLSRRITKGCSAIIRGTSRNFTNSNNKMTGLVVLIEKQKGEKKKALADIKLQINNRRHLMQLRDTSCAESVREQD